MGKCAPFYMNHVEYSFQFRNHKEWMDNVIVTEFQKTVIAEFIGVRFFKRKMHKYLCNVVLIKTLISYQRCIRYGENYSTAQCSRADENTELLLQICQNALRLPYARHIGDEQLKKHRNE
jgi:hypothetical protein